MTIKGLNLFNNYGAKCVHLCPWEEECTSSSWRNSKMYILGTIANLQIDMASYKINENGAAAKVRILVELEIL